MSTVAVQFQKKFWKFGGGRLRGTQSKKILLCVRVADQERLVQPLSSVCSGAPCGGACTAAP